MRARWPPRPRIALVLRRHRCSADEIRAYAEILESIYRVESRKPAAARAKFEENRPGSKHRELEIRRERRSLGRPRAPPASRNRLDHALRAANRISSSRQRRSEVAPSAAERRRIHRFDVGADHNAAPGRRSGFAFSTMVPGSTGDLRGNRPALLRLSAAFFQRPSCRPAGARSSGAGRIERGASLRRCPG